MKSALLIVFIAMATVSGGATPPFDGWESYYAKQDVSRLTKCWDQVALHGALDRLPQSREMLIGFFGAALRPHPELIGSRLKSLDQFSEKRRDDISLILWLADSDVSRALLRQAGLREMASAPCPPVGKRKILSPRDAEFLMGWFYATGDAEALLPLVEFVVTTDWSSTDNRAEACGSALEVLCERHERARSVVEDVLKRKDLSESARKVFQFALGKRANQSSEPRPTAYRSSVERARRRVKLRVVCIGTSRSRYETPGNPKGSEQLDGVRPSFAIF